MFDVGGGELLLIILAVIVLFGPQKLPEIAQMFGKGMKKVRDAQAQFNKQMNSINQEINTTVNQSTRDTADSYDKMKQQALSTPGTVVVDSATNIDISSDKPDISNNTSPDSDNLPPEYKGNTENNSSPNEKKPLG